MSSASFTSNEQETMLDTCILPLTEKSHKGSSGRIGVLGGSARYTGAPYYAAMASLHVGADLSFVFTANEAALAIKSYSPELMVAPVYSSQDFDRYATNSDTDDKEVQSLLDGMVSKVVDDMSKLHVLVIGPGLGRCPMVLKATATIITKAMERNLFLVVDADGLFMLTLEPYRNLLQNYEKVVLTPNVMEYKRLQEADLSLSPKAVVVKKGRHDEVCMGDNSIFCTEEGGMKRSGGIGDVLAGTLGTFLAWNEIMASQGKDVDRMWSCWCACYLVKRATNHAYRQKGRSMTAPNVLDSLWANVDDRTGRKA